MLIVGSLFSGIGGFDLGLERAGMRVVWQCEQDDYCRRVLARHWPGVPCHPDVRALVADAKRSGLMGAGRDQREHDAAGRPERDAAQHQRVADQGSGERDLPVPVPYVDVLCGGFPCQDLSVAGKGAGIDGARSGLWSEYARLIGELRPRYVVVENVSALLARGMGRVLGDLAALGYDAEWDCIPASAVGAPHRRDRIWIVAYPNGGGFQVGSERNGHAAQPGVEASLGHDADRLHTNVAYPSGTQPGAERERVGSGGERGGTDVADAEVVAIGTGLREGEPGGQRRGRLGDSGGARNVADSHGESSGRLAVTRPERDHWLVEPDVGRVANGIPARVDRLRSLGNALVPQIAEWIGRRIVGYEEGQLAA